MINNKQTFDYQICFEPENVMYNKMIPFYNGCI